MFRRNTLKIVYQKANMPPSHVKELLGIKKNRKRLRFCYVNGRKKYAWKSYFHPY